MASTESAPEVQRLAALTPGNLLALDDLVVQSGWNQVCADWDVFWRQGSIGVVRDVERRIIASGALLPLGADSDGASIAWISMILVAPSQRGRGHGAAVFEHCLRVAQGGGHTPMLDATPLGEPLYRQFGFQPTWRLTRWRRGATRAGESAVGAASAGTLEDLVKLDARALAFSRPVLLAELQGRSDSVCMRHSGAIGLVRVGRVAHHIGPLLSSDEADAIGLLRRMCDALSGPVLIDAPSDRPAFAQALSSAGFAPQREFTRMGLASAGQELPRGEPALIHAVAGPEFA